MLGKEATVLFTQIGEKLKTSKDWDWNDCEMEASKFFIESFSESRHAEQMATTLCNIIPFPEKIFLKDADDIDFNIKTDFSFAQVLVACKNFSVLQTPVELNATSDGLENHEVDFVIHCMEFLSELTTVSLRVVHSPLFLFPEDHLCQWLSACKSLSEFSLKFERLHDEDLFLLLGNALASCQTLTKVTFGVPGEGSEYIINAVETGLSADTQLTSVVLEIYSSMSYTAIQALQKLLSNKSLKSLSLLICADVQDLLAAAVGDALAMHRVLNSLDLCFCGKLRSSGASFLEKGVLENISLNYLRVRVYGELPRNGQSVVENLRLAKKSLVECFFYPNTWNNVAGNHFLHVVYNGSHLTQHFTVNVWGEMSCEAAEAIREVLAPSSSFFILNVRGNVTNEVANSIARCLEECKTLSVLSINIWGKLTTEGRIILSRLSKLKVHDVSLSPDESNYLLDFSIDNPAAMRAFFAKVKATREEKVSLTINNRSDVIKGWTRYLGDALAENKSLTSLDVTIQNCLMDEDFGERLGESLSQSTSLTSLSLTFNCLIEECLSNLNDCLDKMASLTTLSLDVNFFIEDNVLVPIKSLCTLSLAVQSGSLRSYWNYGLGDCWIKCTSLKKLSLTVSDKLKNYHVFKGLDKGLAVTTSLDTLSLAVFANDYDCDTFSELFDLLNHGFSLNSSVTTLTVTVTLNEFFIIEFPSIFQEGLSVNMSVTTLYLTINDYGEGESHIPLVLDHSGVFQYLAQNTSVTTFNLTLNSSKEVSDDWVPGLCNALKKNTSLTTLRLKVNSHCSTGDSRLYDFSKLLIESETLDLLELELSFYGKDSGYQKPLIQ